MLPTGKLSEWGTCRASLEKMQPAVRDRPVLHCFSAQSTKMVAECLSNHYSLEENKFKTISCRVRRDGSRKESFSQLIGESKEVYSRTADQHASRTGELTGIWLFDHPGFVRSTSFAPMNVEQEIERDEAAAA